MREDSKNEDFASNSTEIDNFNQFEPTICFVCSSLFNICENKASWKTCEECPNWFCGACANVSLSEDDISFKCSED